MYSRPSRASLAPQPDSLDRKHTAERHKSGRHQPYNYGIIVKYIPLVARTPDQTDG
jgi:hypothetical protein